MTEAPEFIPDMEFKNPILNPNGTIDVELNHPRHGWIPFTADANEEGLGKKIHTLAKPEAKPRPPEPISELGYRALARIEQGYLNALSAGMPYIMADGTEEVIQTRSEDEANLLGLAIEARDLRDVGEEGKVLFIRTQSNKMYAVSPVEMIELTDAAKQFKKDILVKSWELKHKVETALAAKDRDAVEQLSW